MPLSPPPAQYTPPTLGTYPNKLYPNYSGGHGYAFTTRDPKKELEYTSQLLSDILDPTGHWAEAELHVGTTLKTRYNDVVGTLTTNARSTFDSILSQIKTDVYGSTPTATNVAYSQYLAGMSSAYGGGHSSVSMFANLSSQQTQLQVQESAQRIAASIMGLTYQATTAMPLVVPIESQLVNDASASAVEQYNLGQVRDQQVRQSVALGNVLASVSEPVTIGNAPQTPADEVLAYSSINAQGLAAAQL
jgi:hypothetical protein